MESKTNNNDINQEAKVETTSNIQGEKITREPRNLELLLGNEHASELATIKRKMELLSQKILEKIKNYDEEIRINVVSVTEEKDEGIFKKINDTQLNYSFTINGACVAILSLDYLSIKALIAMLLQLKKQENVTQDSLSIKEITPTEKALLNLITSLIGSAIKEIFAVTEVKDKLLFDLMPYIKESTVAITNLSISTSKGKMLLILEPDFIKKCLATEGGNNNLVAIKESIDEVYVELKFVSNKKNISLSALNHLKVDDVIMFDHTINIIANNTKVGLGEIGHMNDNVAIKYKLSDKV